jgi:hypothetical protein
METMHALPGGWAGAKAAGPNGVVAIKYNAVTEFGPDGPDGDGVIDGHRV